MLTTPLSRLNECRSVSMTFNVNKYNLKNNFLDFYQNMNIDGDIDNPTANLSVAHQNIKFKQMEREQFLCPNEECNLQLANKSSLRKHIERIHNPNRVYKYNCDLCIKGFHKSTQLARHKFEHTGIHPLKCEKCNLGCLSLTELNRHMRTHTTYECVCGVTFERYKIMVAHKRLCQIPTCETCGKVFKDKYLLKMHLQTHQSAPSRIYSCYNCGRGYCYKKNLVCHIVQIHQNIVKPKKLCTYPGCGRTFSKNQNLNHHFKVVHSGIVMEKKPRKPRKDKGKSKRKNIGILESLKNYKPPERLEHQVFKSEEVVKEENMPSKSSDQSNKIIFACFLGKIKDEPEDEEVSNFMH